MVSPTAEKKDHYYVANVAEMHQACIELTMHLNVKREYLTMGSNPEEWLPTELMPHSKQRLVSHIGYSLLFLSGCDLELTCKPIYRSYMKDKYVDGIYPIRDFSNVIVIGSKEQLLDLVERFSKAPSCIKHINTLHHEYPDVSKP